MKYMYAKISKPQILTFLSFSLHVHIAVVMRTYSNITTVDFE